MASARSWPRRNPTSAQARLAPDDLGSLRSDRHRRGGRPHGAPPSIPRRESPDWAAKFVQIEKSEARPESNRCFTTQDGFAWFSSTIGSRRKGRTTKIASAGHCRARRSKNSNLLLDLRGRPLTWESDVLASAASPRNAEAVSAGDERLPVDVLGTMCNCL